MVAAPRHCRRRYAPSVVPLTPADVPRPPIGCCEAIAMPPRQSGGRYAPDRCRFSRYPRFAPLCAGWMVMVYCHATSAVSFMVGAVSFMVGASPTVGTDSVRLRGRYILCVVRRFFEMSFFWSSRVARRYWPFRIDAALAEVRPNTKGHRPGPGCKVQ